jgi:hypothetical protein
MKTRKGVTSWPENANKKAATKNQKNETLNNHTDRCMKSDNNYYRPIQENNMKNAAKILAASLDNPTSGLTNAKSRAFRDNKKRNHIKRLNVSFSDTIQIMFWRDCI